MYQVLHPLHPILVRKGESAFTLGEVKTIINRVLNRKQRNNGLGRHLASQLVLAGLCRTDAFECVRAEVREHFEVWLLDNSEILLERINHPSHDARAREKSRKKDLPLHVRSRKKVGSKRHFKRRRITWSHAITAIAHGARLSVHDVHEMLKNSRDEQQRATLVLDGFVFRIHVLAPYRSLIDMSCLVDLLTTNDNRNAMYRRTRASLKRMLDCERRERTKARSSYEAARIERRQYRVLAQRTA